MKPFLLWMNYIYIARKRRRVSLKRGDYLPRSSHIALGRRPLERK
jgi:hypothetical protein